MPPPTPLYRILLPRVRAGCAPAIAAPPAPAPATAGEAWVADRLFFGRDIPGGGSVSDEEWSAFLAEVVTPRFPDGLTILRGEGQWRDARGAVVREASFIVEITHPRGAAADAALEEIATEYKRRFRQEAVMRVRVDADVDFFD